MAYITSHFGALKTAFDGFDVSDQRLFDIERVLAKWTRELMIAGDCDIHWNDLLRGRDCAFSIGYRSRSWVIGVSVHILLPALIACRAVKRTIPTILLL